MNNMENNFEFLFEDDDNSFDLKRIEESIFLKRFLDSISEEYRDFLPSGDLTSTKVLESLSVFDSLLNTNPYYVYLLEAENDKKAAMEQKKAKMVAKFKKQQEAIKQKLAQLKQQEGTLQPDQQAEKIGVTARIKKGNAAKAKVTSIIKKIEGDEKAGDYAKLADVLNGELEAYAKYAKIKVQQIEADKKEGGDKGGDEKKDNPNKSKETEYKKKKLEDKISSAEKKLNDIKDSNPEKAQKIQSAIDSMYDALDKLDKSPNESSYISKYLEIDLKLDSIIAELDGEDEYEIVDQIFTEYVLFEEEGEGDLKQKVKDAKIEYLEATLQTKQVKLGLAGDKGKEKWTNSIKNTEEEIDALKKGEDKKEEKPEEKPEPKEEPKPEEKPETKEEPKEEPKENQEQIDAAQKKVDDLQKEVDDLTQEMDAMMDAEPDGPGSIKTKIKAAQLGFKVMAKGAKLEKAKGELAKAKGEEPKEDDNSSKELEKAKETLKKAEEEGVNLEKAKEAAKEESKKEDEKKEESPEDKSKEEEEKKEESPEDKSKEAKEKKKEEITKIRDLIDKEEKKLESSTEEANEAIKKLKLEMDKKSAGKRKLNTVVNVGRAEGKVEFYKAVLGMAITEDDKETYKEKLKSAQKQLAAMTGDLEKWEKKNKEENQDDPEVQAAQKELKKDEPKEPKEEKPETKEEPKEPKEEKPEKKEEQPETSKVSEPKKEEPKKVPVTNEPKKPEEKKAVKKDENPNDYKIRMAEQKLKGMEDALAKKKQEVSSESDPDKKEKLNKAVASISKNIESAKGVIQDAKSKSNESEDHIFWAIDVMLLTIENQLLNFGNEDDYIYG